MYDERALHVRKERGVFLDKHFEAALSFLSAATHSNSPLEKTKKERGLEGLSVWESISSVGQTAIPVSLTAVPLPWMCSGTTGLYLVQG
jgi:hypothetical protein